jgi:hypothetical protein
VQQHLLGRRLVVVVPLRRRRHYEQCVWLDS